MSIDPLRELLLAEYGQLKEEQRARIGLRDNLIYVTLAAYAAIVVGVTTLGGQGALLLILSGAATVLGWTHLANDEKISAIGRYVRTALAPRVEDLHPRAAPVFDWEGTHRRDQRRRLRKILQASTDLLTFNIPALGGLVYYWVNGPWHWSLITVSLLLLIASAVLGWQRLLHVDLA
ncbi:MULTISPECIES: hypothetical protein [unclassified Micromonospora]|uniref:hypothetical protein n=1 Tax=unclassified Micromonospora TaxID=2617518 RepID=UPI001198A6C5|nr:MULTISPECIES: hypothetical protein [unclassified Micromonospora]QDY09390.1 hypothetical protein FJK98_21360 [Micromonospora sp. HM134]WKU05711.1 hypothetical protein Q2K16_01185 [Micromonospora sp. HUAS LYJ1]